MPAPAKWKMDKLASQETAGVQEMTRRIREARKQVAIIVHSAAREKGLLISGRTRERLYSQIGAQYLQLDNGLKDWSKDLVTKGAVDWHDSAIKDIKGQTGIDPSNDVAKFSREYARDIFARVTPANGRSLAAAITDKMAQTDIKALRDATIDVYRQASLTGMSMREIGTAIKSKWDTIAGDLAANRFVDSAGHAWEDARYVQMLVRTTTARVARDSYMDTLVQNGDDLVVIENADGEACDICSAWDGVITSITGSSREYPSYSQATGAGWGHPNCRCTVARVDETIDKEQIEKQAKADTPDLERMPGETDAEYRGRATEGIARYSKAFWPAAGAGDAAGAIDASAAAAARAAAEAAARAAAEAAARAAAEEAARKAAAAAAREAARKAAEQAAAEAARKAAEAAAAAAKKAADIAAAAQKAEQAKAASLGLMTKAETAAFKDAVKVTMDTAGLAPSLKRAIDEIPDSVWSRLKAPKALQIVSHDIANEKTSGAYYLHSRRAVRMNKDPKHWSGSPSTFKHEIGHDVHYTTKAISDWHINPELATAMENDLANWAARTEKRLGKGGRRALYKRSSMQRGMLEDTLKEHGLHTATAVSDDHRASSMADTIGGLSKGKFGNGHKLDYYKRQNNGAMEAYANIFGGLTSGWTEYERAFPLTTGWIKASLGL
jgi:hypothetical protein